MPVTDLKYCSISHNLPVLYLAQGGSSNVHRQTHFFAGHRSHAKAYIPSMCATVQRQLSCKATCLDQFLCMAFAQMTYRESLRDIEACLRAQQNKLYHMGIRAKISRSTLAEANEKRDWRIYADFAQLPIRLARQLYIHDDFGVELY